MSRTDKDTPWKIAFPEGCSPEEFYRAPFGGDSGFRFARKQLKRVRSKHIRRYAPDAKNNGAKPPYNGLKRTWDFG